MPFNDGFGLRRGSAQRKSAWADLPPIPRKGQYVVQCQKVGDKPDKDYNTGEPITKVSFEFVLLLKGADAAQTDADYQGFVERGHGRKCWINANPYITAPKDGKRASTLYETYIAMAGVDGLSDEDVEALNEDPTPIEAFEGQQFYVFLEPVAGKPTPKVKYVVGPVPDDERLPAYQPREKDADPREVNDDPTLNCERCGNHIRGYAKTKDNAWVSNTEAAAQSKSKHGFAGCGKCIAAEKRAKAASTTKVPF